MKQQGLKTWGCIYEKWSETNECLHSNLRANVQKTGGLMNAELKKINGAIAAPIGFSANGINSGVKKRKCDLSLILSSAPCFVAGVFTKNTVKAAPVTYDMEVLKSGNDVRAVVINSGNANACTGKVGYENTHKMAEKTAATLNLNKNEVLVASTGVIGVQLDMEKIQNGIEKIAKTLGREEKNAGNCAEGIITTDTFIKGIAYEIEISGKPVKIGAIAKGSGMIHPNMGTMLGFVTTDCAINQTLLQKALSETTETTYNMISVDGDTSTNDMVLVLANGMAQNSAIENENEDYFKFKNALEEVNKYLAKQIILDGEGATKFLEVNINGAKTDDDAKKLAKTIISSNLVKTAFFGEDANWGRIIASMGRSGAEFNEQNVKIEFQSDDKHLITMKDGTPLDFDNNYAHELLKNKFITINVTLKDGEAKSTAWGCDLSYEYVRINGEYRT